MSSTLGIYIHVPFCIRKCAYCDFYSVSYNENIADDYVKAVLRNIRHYSDKKRTVDTVYFGGGTPSLLNESQLDTILKEINLCFTLSPDAEITLESNPCTLNLQKLVNLRKTGINRISLGVQSLSDKELGALGRLHSAKDAVRAVCDADCAGFNNISCDLMIGTPYQSSASLEKSILELTGLPVQHISAYLLKIEKNTPFDRSDIRKIIPDEDGYAELYLQTVKLLAEHGFEQYEVSNFAKKGFESRHNCRYWRCEDYLGIGPAAHSCCFGKRFAVNRDLNKFISQEIQPVTVTDEAPCGFEEYSMLRLRLREGLDVTLTGSHREAIERKIPALVSAGYAEFDGRFISLTPKGFLVSNSVIEYLIF